MARRVVAIQHVSAEPMGTVAGMLSAAGIRPDVVRIDRNDAVPTSPAGLGGLVVMGGPMGVYEADRHPFLRDELKLIADAHQRGVPVLGICLGAQLLAGALGARVFPSGIKEIGWYPVTLTPEAASDPLFAKAPTSFQAFHWHGDTYDLPAGAVRLASSKLTREQAFRVGASSYGLQFHLEVTPEVIAAMMNGADAELAAAGVDPNAMRAATKEHVEKLASVARSVFSPWIERVTRAH